MLDEYQKIAIIIILISFFFILSTECIDSSHSLKILPGEEYIGKINYKKEPESRIEWNIEGDRITIQILFENKKIFSTDKMKGSFSLKKKKEGIYKIIVKNYSNKPAEIKYKISHRYIGSMGITLTVTKDIKLERYYD